MKEKALVAFKSKLFINPCKQFLKLFKFKFKKPIGLRFRRRHHRSTPLKSSSNRRKKRFRPLFSIFKPSYWKEKEVAAVVDHDQVEDEIGELTSMIDAGRERLLVPSPITPIYNRVMMKRSGDHNGEGSDDQNEVEDACRSFENYLTEMIVNEGKVRDLTDVEELLYCWKNLKSPVFIDLVCRFYGELCKDLFSSRREEDDTVTNYSDLH